MTLITNMPMYRAIAIRQALIFYADTGMKVNRAYTPTAMLAAVKDITGHTYRRGQYRAAADALQEWINARVAEGEDLQTDKQL